MKGSHWHFKHPAKKGRMPPHPKCDMPKGTVNSIYKQAGLKYHPRKRSLIYYPIAIRKEQNSTTARLCPNFLAVSLGTTTEQALVMIKEAIELRIEGMVSDGEPVPTPTPMELIVLSGEFQHCTWALVEINLEKLMGPAERINITVPRVALRRIDAAAARVGMNRFQYLINAALATS